MVFELIEQNLARLYELKDKIEKLLHSFKYVGNIECDIDFVDYYFGGDDLSVCHRRNSECSVPCPCIWEMLQARCLSYLKSWPCEEGQSGKQLVFCSSVLT